MVDWISSSRFLFVALLLLAVFFCARFAVEAVATVGFGGLGGAVVGLL